MGRFFVVPALLGLALASVTVPASALRLPVTFAGGGSSLNPDIVALTQISADTFTNSDSQHKTEVGPDTFVWGNTMVSSFQMGRYNANGGSSDVGWATSTDGGMTWKNGFFKGITKVQNPANKYDRASDPAVAYDLKAGHWIVEVLPLTAGSGLYPVVTISKNGLTWGAPIKTHKDNGDYIDKPWIVCDNTKTSPHYGNCYIEEDDFTLGDQEMMMTLKDGGKTWSAPYTVTNVLGLGGQPLVQPNGTVIVPHLDTDGTMGSFISTDGGTTWGNEATIATVNYNTQAGGIRSTDLPTAEIDAAGTVYVAWPDCSFRANCALDDIVYSTSSDGQTWSPIARVPIDPVSSKVDHFLPGLAVDPATSGSQAHVSVTYYYYPNGGCTTCTLYVGNVSSTNAGSSWTKAKKLAGPMQLTWLPSTTSGYMVGDYMSTSFLAGKVRPGFAKATAVQGSVFNEFIATTKAGLVPALEPGETSSRGERQISRHVRMFPIRPLN